MPCMPQEHAHVNASPSELARKINCDIILDHIRSLQPLSRVELAHASGLQPSTVSSIVEQLLMERWISEGATIKTARGRRPTLLMLNEDLVLLAADIRSAHATIALVDLNGRLLTRKIVPISPSPELSVAFIAAAMKNIHAEHYKRTFKGIGIILPGRVDPMSNELVLTPNLAWINYDIAEQLRIALGLGVQMENAANACLLSELWFGRKENLRNAILATISEGIDAAILVQGRLITGHCGLAGEFAHVCVDPDGPYCSCGARGCWEVFASGSAALRYFDELQSHSKPTTFVQLISLALTGDIAASTALERQAMAIGRGLRLLDTLVSSDHIFLAGDVTLLPERYRRIIDREFRDGLTAEEGPRVHSVADDELSTLR